MSIPVRLAITLLLALGGLGLMGSTAALAADPGYTSCPSLSNLQSDVNSIGSNGTGTITFDIAGCFYSTSTPITTPDGSDVTIFGNGLTVSGNSGNFNLIETGSNGSLTLDHTTLEYGGSGIVAGGGSVTLTSSTVIDNHSSGINSAGSVTVTNSTISGNGFHGIFAISGTVTATNSTISGNYGNGIFAAYGTAAVTNSTVSGNSVVGISANYGTVTVINSTISGNSVVGIADDRGTVSVINSTVSGNGDYGIHAVYGTITVTASLLASNAPNCVISGLTDDGYNLSTDLSCGFSGTGSQNGVSPSALNLGTLGDYGGPTQTIPLLPGSIAIDAIPPTTSGACSVGETTDQREISRPQGSGCDIGAYETVTYDINPLFDQAKAMKAGSTLPVKLQILNAVGVNLSAPDTTVMAIDIDGDSNLLHTAGMANLGNVFRYDSSLDGYLLNLKTTSLSFGVHTLNFKVSFDPEEHSVTFIIT